MQSMLRYLSLCLVLFASSALAENNEVDYLELAALLLRDGNLERAIVALNQVDTESESLDKLRYFTLSGMAYLRSEQAELAANKLENAVNTGMAESIVFIYLAQSYFQLERYRDVLRALDRANGKLDSIASVYQMKAQCHWLLGEHAMALATLDLAGELFPEDQGFLRRKVFFLVELGLYREAAEQGRIYLARSEGKREDFIALGNAMRISGEPQQAARLLEQARLMFPGDTEINKVLARIYMDLGQLNTAAQLVYEASLIDPALTSEAAELYRQAGQHNRALSLNGRITDQLTKFKQRLALLLELQHFEQAAAMESDIRRVGLLDNEDVRYALAYAVFKTGDYAAAELHLQALTRPDLFRKAAELRRAIQDCTGETWQCL